MERREGVYDRKRQLGRGIYGEVWLAVHHDTGKEYAMKVIGFAPNESSSFMKEASETGLIS